MPNNVSQHFVPKVYLRSFSSDERRRSINIYNIDRKMMIKNASIKDQCAQDHFYGKDLVLERYFQTLEGDYGSVVKTISNDIGEVSKGDIEKLRQFCYLQYMRTEGAFLRAQSWWKSSTEEIFHGRSAMNIPDMPSDYYLKISNIKNYFDSMHIIEDLETVIIINKSRIPFITCDDPVVFTNRFYIQKLKMDNFGISSSGVIFLFPLTPVHMLLIYDKKIYTCEKNSKNSLIVSNDSDVSIINMFQASKVKRNYYFDKWADFNEESVHYFINLYGKQNTSTTDILVEDKMRGGAIYYRRANEVERGTALRTLAVSSIRYPKYSSWPGVLRFRQNPVTYYNGSGVGYVRKKRWLTERP